MTTRAKPPAPVRGRSPIRKIPCARGCGWYRAYTDAAWYLTRTIVHPLYGLVSGEQLVRLDMWNHQCEMHLERQARAREATGYKSRVHSAG